MEYSPWFIHSDKVSAISSVYFNKTCALIQKVRILNGVEIYGDCIKIQGV